MRDESKFFPCRGRQWYLCALADELPMYLTAFHVRAASLQWAATWRRCLFTQSLAGEFESHPCTFKDKGFLIWIRSYPQKRDSCYAIAHGMHEGHETKVGERNSKERRYGLLRFEGASGEQYVGTQQQSRSTHPD